MEKLILWLSLWSAASVVAAFVVTGIPLRPKSSIQEDIEYGFLRCLWVRVYCAGIESTMTHKTGLPRWFRKAVARTFIHRVWIVGRLHGIRETLDWEDVRTEAEYSWREE